MAFLTETAPQNFVPIDVAPGIRRLVAPNAGPMTYHGTNTWLLDEADGVVVIDPGPADADHVAAILAASGRRVARILITHGHADHVAGVPMLVAETGAPVFGWDGRFDERERLGDGDRVGGLEALHTPGHASDHLCFAHPSGILFTGDHVMSWNTSIVALPDGDMGAYMQGLRRLLGRADTLYLCGHGPPLPEPQLLTRAMLTHRVAREAALLAALRKAPQDADALVASMYAGLDARLVKAARLTVLAHLGKLEGEGRAWRDGGVWVTEQGRPGLCPGPAGA